jgi:hypothetical protein
MRWASLQLLAIVVALVLGFAQPIGAKADQGQPGDPVLTIDPLAAIQTGEFDTVTVVAHFRTSDGKPIANAYLKLFVDGQMEQGDTTDPNGNTYMRFRGHLAVGAHQVEVAFEGTKGSLAWVKPSRAAQTLVVQPADVTHLRVDPIPAVLTGSQDIIAIVAHLSTVDGQPIPGEDLQLTVDGVTEPVGATDATGTAYLRFRRVMSTGDHHLEVSFAGGSGLQPATTTSVVTVSPIPRPVLTIDPPPAIVAGGRADNVIVAHLKAADGVSIPGKILQLAVDNIPVSVDTTDVAGAVHLPMGSALAVGNYTLTVSFAGTSSLRPAVAKAEVQVVAPYAALLTLDALDPIPSGDSKSTVLTAHLTTSTGDPIVKDQLVFAIDGDREGSRTTDAQGTAILRLARQLAPGTHHLSVSYDGGPGVGPATTIADLTVLPSPASALVLEKVRSSVVGDSSPINVAARLASDDGKPIVRAPIVLFLDQTPVRTESSDASGAVVFRLPTDISAGQHSLDVGFAGLHGYLPSTAHDVLLVDPALFTIQVVPALPGVRASFDGRTFTSGADGAIHLQAERAGIYRVEVLPWDSSIPGTKATFARWLDDVFVPYRDVIVPSNARLQVGFETEYLTSLRFDNLDDHAVPTERISSAVLNNSIGDRYVFQNGEAQWVAAERLTKTTAGLVPSKLFYSVEAVFVETANVVNAKQQKFFPSPNLVFPVKLLFYSANISAVDAFFGFPIGTAIVLEYPDGHAERHPFGADQQVSLSDLIRGEYHLSVEAPAPAISRTLALTRNVEESIHVLSYYDLAVVALAALLFVLGLPLLGRPRLRRHLLRPWRLLTPTGRAVFVETSNVVNAKQTGVSPRPNLASPVRSPSRNVGKSGQVRRYYDAALVAGAALLLVLGRLRLRRHIPPPRTPLTPSIPRRAEPRDLR